MFYKIIIIFLKTIKNYTFILFRVDNLVHYGIKLNLRHPSISKNLKRTFYNGSYEKDEVVILSQYLQPDDVVMEIGAGIGFLSAFCALRVGNDKVFAYEANPNMLKKIKETYDLNNVAPTISNVLLSDSSGEIDFYLEEDFWSSSIVKRSKEANKIKVKTKNINLDIIENNPSLLIIDIEGGEMQLLPMIKFNNIQKVIIEVHPHVIGQREVSKVIALLIENGFNLDLGVSKGIVLFFKKNVV